MFEIAKLVERTEKSIHKFRSVFATVAGYQN